MKSHKFAASVGALFITMLCAQGAYAQDQGNIAVMYYPAAWDAYDTETMPGMGNDAPRKYLSQIFYGSGPVHLDQFDFLVVMTNFPYEITENGRATDSSAPEHPQDSHPRAVIYWLQLQR